MKGSIDDGIFWIVLVNRKYWFLLDRVRLGCCSRENNDLVS